MRNSPETGRDYQHSGGAILTASVQRLHLENTFNRGPMGRTRSGSAIPAIASQDKWKPRLTGERRSDDVTDAVSIYLGEISRIPLLSAEEETKLAQAIELGNQAITRMDCFNGNLTPGEKEKLEQDMREGKTARNRLAEGNVRLVVSVARRHLGRGVPLLDLIQEGNIGLTRAVGKFDYRKGFKFSTYATWWIRQAVTRTVANQGRTIRLPVYMSEKLSKFSRMEEQLMKELGREATNEELAAAMEVPVKEVRKCREISQSSLSLETPVGAEEESTIGDFIEDTKEPTPHQAATNSAMREDLNDVLNSLSSKEHQVLKLRFGLGDDRSRTLEEVGRKLGVTKERIRQIEAKALRKLRSSENTKKLQPYLD